MGKLSQHVLFSRTVYGILSCLDYLCMRWFVVGTVMMGNLCSQRLLILVGCPAPDIRIKLCVSPSWWPTNCPQSTSICVGDDLSAISREAADQDAGRRLTHAAIGDRSPVVTSLPPWGLGLAVCDDTPQRGFCCDLGGRVCFLLQFFI